MFITFEGIEGSGKTTQIEHLGDYLKNRGLAYFVTREPGGTRIGQSIRAILLDPDNTNMDPATELLLYTADRIQHITQTISPRLRDGQIVLCDRFFDATLVYQGFARGLDQQQIIRLHELICRNMKPDVTFLFDLPVEEGLARAWHQIHNGDRSQAETRFEHEAIEFHQKVREGYLTLASREPDRFEIIDAAQDREVVKAQLISRLANRLDSLPKKSAEC
ncbi:MAG: dTMP kinase [Deltaproteobacteria bacterium]|nr:dTMP kinase [Deltaproteobacteria bacterium]